MLFNSYTFLIFFCAVLAVYYALPSWYGRKLLLLVASYIFYAAWNPPFVVLLWISTIADWYLAKLIFNSQSSSLRRLFLTGSLSINLGLLAFFKYGNFILNNFIDLLNFIGIEFSPVQLNIILPVGISFYTFQTLSYTIDIYLKKAKPSNSFLDYALYVTFFPQLVAGPIVRASDFLQQCENKKRFSINNLGWGLTLITLGLFQKVVIADALLAPITEKLYSATGFPNFTTAWGGTLAFAGQIFCDFAGYSTCAIGTALCLGFHLPENFTSPYAAIGFSDFWRRWHITLSTWLRDYLYIPLGGNRKGLLRTQINLMITMLLGGLWHGASWTFVVWGGLHGIYLVLERFLKGWLGHLAIWKNSLIKLSLGILTFLLICITWVFFRANSFPQAWGIVTAMLGVVSLPASIVLGKQDLLIAFAVVASILIIHWLLRTQTLETVITKIPWWFTSSLIAFMLYAIFTMPGEDRSFIYFQF